MKLVSIILIFFLSSAAMAQDDRLFENTWYLHYMVIDGVNRVPPTLPNTAYADFFANGDLFTAYCPEEAGGTFITYFGTTEFSHGPMGWLLGGCYTGWSSLYNNLYQNFWSTPNQIFSYEIIDNGQLRTLIITNPETDIAIFGDTIILENPDFDEKFIGLYPNPVKDNLHITNSLGTKIQYMEIVAITGQRLRAIMANVQSVDVSELSPGIYFLRIRDLNDVWYVRKFVKQ